MSQPWFLAPLTAGLPEVKMEPDRARVATGTELTAVVNALESASNSICCDKDRHFGERETLNAAAHLLLPRPQMCRCQG